jgi:hypothetical protein
MLDLWFTFSCIPIGLYRGKLDVLEMEKVFIRHDWELVGDSVRLVGSLWNFSGRLGC